MSPRDLAGELLAHRRDDLVAIRRHLHAHPELSFEEFATTELIAERLSAIGAEPRILDGGTGVICDLGEGTRCVALRADIDGLGMADTKEVPYRSRVEGVAHGCGHDLHTTVVLGAGLALAGAELTGRVRLIFEPGEEQVPGGAVGVIDAGGLDGVERIFGFHADPKLAVGRVGIRHGALTSAADMVVLTLTGPGGHTARPELTVDLVALAGRVAAELPRRVAERLTPHGRLQVVFGAILAGDAANVIPTTAVLRGSVRTPDLAARERAEATIAEVAAELVGEHGATCRIDYTSGVPPVVNDPGAAGVMAAAVADTLGADALTEPPRSAGADTFSWYQQHVPGCYGRLGVHDPERPEMLDLHSGAFDVDERAIDVGVRVLVATALRALVAP